MAYVMSPEANKIGSLAQHIAITIKICKHEVVETHNFKIKAPQAPHQL